MTLRKAIIYKKLLATFHYAVAIDLPSQYVQCGEGTMSKK